MKTYIGIDPGKKGAIAIVQEQSLELHKMPLNVAGEIDGQALYTLLTDWAKAENVLLGVEKVGAMPGQGVTSMFTFGFGCGIIEGIVCALNLPFVKITPQTWQKLAFEGIAPIYKPAKAKKDSEDKPAKPAKEKLDTGKMSILAASRLYPSANLLASARAKVPDDGLSDALLIAHYLKVNNR